MIMLLHSEAARDALLTGMKQQSDRQSSTTKHLARDNKPRQGQPQVYTRFSLKDVLWIASTAINIVLERLASTSTTSQISQRWSSGKSKRRRWGTSITARPPFDSRKYLANRKPPLNAPSITGNSFVGESEQLQAIKERHQIARFVVISYRAGRRRRVSKVEK